MLRSLVALVVLANLLFFAWARGWLAPAWPAPRHAEREPERLAAQVRPDTLSVVPPTAASAAVAAARAAAVVCLEAGPFAPEPEAGLAAAEAVLLQAALAEGSWAREAVVPAPVKSVSPSQSWVLSENHSPVGSVKYDPTGLKHALVIVPFRHADDV